MMQEQPEPESKDDKEIKFAYVACIGMIAMLVTLAMLNLIPIWFGAAISVFVVGYTSYIVLLVK